ncbi:MAG: hypothetical protein GX075_13915 [Firmicutes bacterium]|nr:hypothetical protein [Bacillota bacterium]
MHIFIVYAHPDEKSFTHSVLDSFLRGITEAGHTYEISDLYKMDFRTDMSLDEYHRESSRNISLYLSNLILRSIFYNRSPALLSGWLPFSISFEALRSPVKPGFGMLLYYLTAGFNPWRTKSHLPTSRFTNTGRLFYQPEILPFPGQEINHPRHSGPVSSQAIS